MRAFVGVLALAEPACAAPATPRFELAIRVESDRGVPLPGATLSALGEPLGATDARGLLVAALPGLAGETIELAVDCPGGYRSPAQGLTVRLRSPADRSGRPEYRVLCPPVLRRLVVAVRAEGGANLPVLVLGDEIARTDREGVAHALLAAAPGDTILVKLDTSAPAQRALMPRDPELKIVVPEHDELVLFDQAFVRPAAPRRRHKHVGPQPI